MKQLSFLLDSVLKRAKIDESAKPDCAIDKSDTKDHTYEFPVIFKNTSMSYCWKWFNEKLKWFKQENSLYSGSFQEATGSIVAFAQFFAIMPVAGVTGKSTATLRFEWKSIRFGYSFVMFIFMVIYAGMTFWITVSSKIDFDRFIPLIFYGSGVYGMFSFGILARKWPKIMQNWELIETQLPKYRSHEEKRKLAYHMKMLAIIVLSASLIENVLSNISILYYSIECLKHKEPFKELIKVNLSQLFTFLPYSIWLAIVGKWVNILATFTWTYMDLFVMLISLGLSSNFRRINDDLQRIKNENMSEEFWALRRKQYRDLSCLCVLVDDAISKITLLSLTNNFFFICVQLMRSIKPQVSVPHAVYFWFSLTFLISRTLAVSLYAAHIYDESKKPMDVLRAVPNQSWCTDVRRFGEQVVNDTIALTGMRFFFLTRNLILTVAGTIVTYELVLNQFYTSETPQTACQTSSS